MISSYVSSSISTVVIVSSTSPRIMLRCWSYAYTAHKHSKRVKSRSSQSARNTRTCSTAKVCGERCMQSVHSTKH